MLGSNRSDVLRSKCMVPVIRYAAHMLHADVLWAYSCAAPPAAPPPAAVGAVRAGAPELEGPWLTGMREWAAGRADLDTAAVSVHALGQWSHALLCQGFSATNHDRAYRMHA